MDNDNTQTQTATPANDQFTPFPEDTYTTPENLPVSFLARHFPSWVFYAKMIKLYYTAGTAAGKPGYSGTQWARDSYICIENMHSVGGRFFIEGLDHFRHLPTPCIFASNHMSTLETIALPSIVQSITDMTFIMKPSLLNYPIFRNILIAREPIIVSRSNPRADFKLMVEETCKNVQKGRSIIVFPQGTRRAVFDPAEFNSIAVKLAKHANVPVIPVALYTLAWGMGKILRDFGFIRPEIPIHFAFGEPIYVGDNSKEAQQKIIQFITDKLRQWDPNAVVAQ